LFEKRFHNIASMKSQIVAALIVGAVGARRNHVAEVLQAQETIEGGFEEFEVDESVNRGPLGSCEVVSRRRAFSTTCACRRRSSSDANDHGLECIDSAMRCPEGTTWDGDNCASAAAAGGGEGGGGGGPTTTPVPTRNPADAVELRAPSVGDGDPANNPVTELYMYRAQEFDGETPYAMENVNMADLPGVIQYIHREIIAEHTIGAVDRRTGEARAARKYDISTILRYRFLIKNPDTLSGVSMDFNGYVTFDFGQASNRQQWGDFTDHGDFVGAQTQSNTHVPFNDPYYWFSLSGFCPNLPFTSAAITTLCPENPQTLSGTCSSKEESKNFGCGTTNDRAMDKCLCYADGSVVWGGLCGADESRSPPTEIEVPTGGRGCTYSYDPHPESINIDELVGIKAETCRGQPCADWADFRENCDNPQLKRAFTALGGIKRVAYCVEYDIHPDCAQLGCDHPTCQRVGADYELGLPFWKGRCSGRSNAARAEHASEAFGVEHAASSHLITVPSSENYENVACNRTSSLECSPNMLFGEGYCTRAWSGICTSCRITGTEQPTANQNPPYCPWTVAATTSEYHHTLVGGRWCKSSLKPSEMCCLYSDSCAIKRADVPGMVDTLPLDDDSLALVLSTSDTDTVHTYLTRIAKELLGVVDADLEEKAVELTEESYWAWGDKPNVDFVEDDIIRLSKAADILFAMFPGSTQYTTAVPTTSTTTTTRRAWHFITTAAPGASAPSADLPPQCVCSDSGIVNGVDTHRPGCSAHLGRGYGAFCYIEGGNECPGNIRYSRSLGVHYRRRC